MHYSRRKVGTTQSTMLPNGKDPGIQKARETASATENDYRVPIVKTGHGKGENAV